MKIVVKSLMGIVATVGLLVGGSTFVSAANKAEIKGATTKSITLGTSFNAKTKVTAVDSNGRSITKNIKTTGTVNSNKKGVYYVTYKVKASSSKTLTVKRKVIVNAKSYKIKTPTRQFQAKDGFGRKAVYKIGSNLSLIQKSSGGWYKTSKGYWIKAGFVGDFIYVGKKQKVYKYSTSTTSSKYASYGISAVTGSSVAKKRIKTKDGWISNPVYVDSYASKGIKDQQTAILNLVNKERKAAGVNPLKLDTKLSLYAVIRSSDMVENRYFSHTSPTYGSYSNLVNHSGYDYLMTGENIAAGGNSAQQYMTMWMNSSGHRENILRSGYDSIGIGVVKNTKSGFYSSVATQIFGLKN